MLLSLKKSEVFWLGEMFCDWPDSLITDKEVKKKYENKALIHSINNFYTDLEYNSLRAEKIYATPRKPGALSSR
jgi:hypothetical protein